MLRRFLKQDEAVTAIEYALIASLIAVIIIGAVTIVGVKVNDNFTAVADQFP